MCFEVTLLIPKVVSWLVTSGILRTPVRYQQSFEVTLLTPKVVSWLVSYLGNWCPGYLPREYLGHQFGISKVTSKMCFEVTLLIPKVVSWLVTSGILRTPVQYQQSCLENVFRGNFADTESGVLASYLGNT